ncbi:hypothetical protein F4778DRAFT_781912 [Xylariomycetidae sp. FL2044]|nr:hypothetical protein F4778DRAFT_781912 [Xylariomycetidae sp. FL2044]
MFSKLATALLALAATSALATPVTFVTPVALATPVARQDATRYTLSLSAPDAPLLDGQAVNATGQAFWAGKPTGVYCAPGTPYSASYPNTTVIRAAAGGGGTVGLAVVVPGGQRIYVAPAGALSFTIAHSAYIPEGSYTTGIEVAEGGDELLFTAVENSGWYVCGDGSGGEAVQIFALVPAAAICANAQTVRILVQPTDASFGAFQYT